LSTGNRKTELFPNETGKQQKSDINAFGLDALD